jgi:hypothetical protein
MDHRDPEAPAAIDPMEDALENLRTAAGVKVPPWLALVSALCAVRPPSIAATIDWLNEHRALLQSTFDEGARAPLALGRLTRDLEYEPELAGMDRARNDHLLRGRWLFRDLVGKRSFFQAMIFAITGVELSASDAELIEQLGVANLVADRRIWPLAVARRVVAHGGDFATGIVAGKALFGSPIFGGATAASFARFLQRVDRELAQGRTLDEVMDEVIEKRERIMGFGRPVVGPDERVPPVKALLERYGRDRGPNVTLLRAIEARLSADRGLHSNVAAWLAAVMSDLGLSPGGVQAMANIYLTVCLFAQVVFSAEQAAARAAETRAR